MYQPKKVLTIDDDEDINRLLKVKFEKLHFVFESTTNTQDFLKKLVEFRPNLILVDLNLEGEQGFGYKIVQTLRKKIGQEVVIIVMSKRDSHEDIMRALELGANDYITKPIDDVLLLSKVQLFIDETVGIQSLKYSAIPAVDSEITFDVDMKLIELSEEGIKLFSKALISKNTYIKLTGALPNLLCPNGELKFSVKEVLIDKLHNGFSIYIEFDDHEHAQIVRNVRKLLLKVDPLTEDEVKGLVPDN